MTLRAVLFDLDGTLLDTSGDLGGALNALRLAKNLEPLPLAQLRPQVSNGANALIKLGFGNDMSAEEFQLLRAELLAFYLADIARFTTPFDGIPELIENLTRYNISWGIATNKPWLYTQALMLNFNFASAPSIVLCPDHVPEAKPHPEMLLLACRQLGVSPQEMVYVGDHQRDIECGRRANIKTLAVGYGFTQHAEEHTTWSADHCVNHASEIWPVLQQFYL